MVLIINIICSKYVLDRIFLRTIGRICLRITPFTRVSLRRLLSSLISYQIASVQQRNYRNQMLDVEVSREEIEEAAAERFELLSGR